MTNRPPRAPRLPRDHFYPKSTVAETVRVLLYVLAIVALIAWAGWH